uniref:Transcriptional regulator, AraC family n=2 Tax=Cupriavidus TaxID=106589 RepID=Q46MJ3_CUPPJ
MSSPRRSKRDIEHVDYSPAKPYSYDLEVFRLSDLKRRSGADALRRSYSYEFYMLICVTEGKCIQLVDFEAVPCRAGTLLILHPGQAHNFGIEEDWDGWMLLASPEVLSPVAFAQTAPWPLIDLAGLPGCIQFANDDRHRAEAEIQRLYEDALIAPGPSADVHALLRYRFYAFVAWLVVVYGRQYPGVALLSGSLQRFNRFQGLVDERFAEWNQLGDYARHLGCSEKTLTRAAIAAVGVSAKSLISRRINLEAKRLLAHTALSVGAIAEKLGFQEATHFSKFFKRETGCTPREFRDRGCFDL